MTRRHNSRGGARLFPPRTFDLLFPRRGVNLLHLVLFCSPPRAHMRLSPQRRPHLPHLPRGGWRGGPAVPLLLHGHAGHGAPELPGDVAVVLQHQLLRALQNGVQHRAGAAAALGGKKGVPPHLVWFASLLLRRSFCCEPELRAVVAQMRIRA